MLHELTAIKYKTKKRVGRGPASGKGKTSGRGHNGQKSRAGKKFYLTFEGGQTRLAKLLPKLKGFQNTAKIVPQIVNLDKLNSFDSETIVTKQLLAEKGFISTVNRPVKILGKGTLKSQLTVQADSFSASAIEKIQKVGGKHEVISDNN